ncbi:unnamed protein product [Larinioides sclopetarius]|uniref:TRUD domain-containing protein n=1 Tax=Larinioides sclopetarius TaxID=280406 RepID=A0AAV2B0I0_9ARAC
MEVICNSKHSLDDKEAESSNKKQCLEPGILSSNEPCGTAGSDKLSSDQNENSFKRASEQDVGITEYLSDLPGFKAIMKERYSDFIVNEIDTEGNVVRLTNLEKPKNPESDFKVDGLLEETTIQGIEQLIADERSEVEINVTEKDKDTRKDIHVAIRKMFNGVESSTEDRGSEKFIIVKRFTKQKKRRRGQLSVGGNYLHFVLYKENKDTMDAINGVASYLRVNPKVFAYAGSKDKRGKTSQLVSAYQISPERLLKINNDFNTIRVGNIVFKNEQLKLGDLRGNRFIIILRQLQGDPTIIEKAIDSLSSKGFINYYGLQRFGTSSVSTHSIGSCKGIMKERELSHTPILLFSFHLS